MNLKKEPLLYSGYGHQNDDANIYFINIAVIVVDFMKVVDYVPVRVLLSIAALLKA